jgi:hypothetical protein
LGSGCWMVQLVEARAAGPPSKGPR